MFTHHTRSSAVSPVRPIIHDPRYAAVLNDDAEGGAFEIRLLRILPCTTPLAIKE